MVVCFNEKLQLLICERCSISCSTLWSYTSKWSLTTTGRHSSVWTTTGWCFKRHTSVFITRSFPTVVGFWQVSWEVMWGCYDTGDCGWFLAGVLGSDVSGDNGAGDCGWFLAGVLASGVRGELVWSDLTCCWLNQVETHLLHLIALLPQWQTRGKTHQHLWSSSHLSQSFAVLHSIFLQNWLYNYSLLLNSYLSLLENHNLHIIIS